MANNDNITIVNSSFGFSNSSCEVLISNGHDENGIPYTNARIKSSAEKQIDFHFTRALYRTTDSEDNVLLDFISIPNGNTKKLESFFNKNGFLFQNSSEIYNLYSCADLFLLIKRVKLLVDLIREIQNKTPSVDILLHNTLYLLLTEQLSISVSDETVIYKSPSHKLQGYLTGKGALTSAPADIDYEYYTSKEFQLKYGDKVFFEHDGYENTYIDRAYDMPNDMLTFLDFMDNVISLYRIEYINMKDGVVLSKFKKKPLDIELLKKAARYVIKAELDHHTSKIRPSYNSDDLLAAWNIPDLISSIYFSIFFLNPKFELIKKCANPNCTRYFSVLSSNTRKKYCDTLCANAVGQRNLRIRRGEEKQNKRSTDK